MSAAAAATSNGSQVGVRAVQLVVDCEDLERVTGFWTAFLGLRVGRRAEEWVDLESIADGLTLCFQQVPERKKGKNRLHLDLATADVEAAGRLAEGLGATPASELYDADGSPWRVWRDPEGNEFCLVSAHGDDEANV